MLRPQPMPDYFTEDALLPEGWARDVRIRVSQSGVIDSVAEGQSADGAERLSGPVIPGMVNLHSHAFQRAMAGLAERASPAGDNFWSWREVMYDFAARVTPEDLHAIAAQLFVELLRHGYTSVGEFHYLHNQPGGTPYETRAEMSVQVVEAARRAGIAITHMPVLYAFGGFGEQPLGDAQMRFRAEPEHALGVAADLAERYHDDPRVVVGIAPHSLRAVNLSMLQETVSGLTNLDSAAPIHIHIAEQAKEVEDCLAWSGQRPIEWLLSNVAPDGRWCLIHATHAQESELEGIAASGAAVGLCPTTEANLGDGIFKLEAFAAANGRFGIGSDSNVSVSPVEELRWLEYGQRLHLQRRNVFATQANPSAGASLWRAAAEGGASAIAQPAGTIAVGKRADLVVLDPKSPNLAGKTGDQILDAFVFSGNDSAVDRVMVAGKWVVEGGSHPDGERTAAAFRAVLHKLST